MTTSSSELKRKLDLFEFAPGKKASWSTLERLLPDVKTALFFAKAYRLDYHQLSALIYGLFKTGIFAVLGNGQHSVDLQDYIVDTVPPDVWPEDVDPDYSPDVPVGEFLPELWDAAAITIAKSISEVADKLGSVLDALPSKEGSMVFESMMKLNRQRPTIGVHQAAIKHQAMPSNLVILDVSGSMSADTIEKIVDDVVALSWKADAFLAIVSTNTYVWEPGTYGVEDVLRRAEYGGTNYETLAPLFDRDWGTVITIADYDSSPYAKAPVAAKHGRIGKVLDISLVNRPTYLAEVVGQLADDVEPLLVASTSYILPS